MVCSPKKKIFCGLLSICTDAACTGNKELLGAAGVPPCLQVSHDYLLWQGYREPLNLLKICKNCFTGNHLQDLSTYLDNMSSTIAASKVSDLFPLSFIRGKTASTIHNMVGLHIITEY